MQLVATSDNPLPPDAEIAEIETRDGVRLRAASWRRSEGPKRGAVVILQGRAEFIEKYFEVIGELRSRGFAVIAFDWRGQGRSDRCLAARYHGHIRHFDDFRLDYEAVRDYFHDAWSRGPVHGLAHSMGGCIALTGAHEGWLQVDRLIASSPMLGLSLVRRPALARNLARALAWAGFGSRLVPGGHLRSISTLPFEGNRLCTDPERYARNAAVATALDWGAIGSPTIGWVLAAYEAMDRLQTPAIPGAIEVPTLVVTGDDDPICSTPDTEHFARALGRGTIVTVPGARHEILMETNEMRSIFWAAFDAFMADEATTSVPSELSA